MVKPAIDVYMHSTADQSSERHTAQICECDLITSNVKSLVMHVFFISSKIARFEKYVSHQHLHAFSFASFFSAIIRPRLTLLDFFLFQLTMEVSFPCIVIDWCVFGKTEEWKSCLTAAYYI